MTTPASTTTTTGAGTLGVATTTTGAMTGETAGATRGTERTEMKRPHKSRNLSPTAALYLSAFDSYLAAADRHHLYQ